jgi:hypothetical protein
MRKLSVALLPVYKVSISENEIRAVEKLSRGGDEGGGWGGGEYIERVPDSFAIVLFRSFPGPSPVS